jgi:hypothetical protein
LAGKVFPMGWPMSFKSAPNHFSFTLKALPPLMRGNSMARSGVPFYVFDIANYVGDPAKNFDTLNSTKMLGNF